MMLTAGQQLDSSWTWTIHGRFIFQSYFLRYREAGGAVIQPSSGVNLSSWKVPTQNYSCTFYCWQRSHRHPRKPELGLVKSWIALFKQTTIWASSVSDPENRPGRKKKLFSRSSPVLSFKNKRLLILLMLGEDREILGFGHNKDDAFIGLWGRRGMAEREGCNAPQQIRLDLVRLLFC